MRHTELPWPFEGWTVDENGVIHTASGYRTTPQKIEAFCWLLGMHNAVNTFGAARIMFNESSTEEKRPVFDWRDTLLETPRPNDIKAPSRRSRLGKSAAPPKSSPVGKSARRSPT